MIGLVALGLAVGAFGPWVAVGGAVDFKGIEGDGVLTLAVALVLTATLIVARLRRRPPLWWTLAGCAVVAVGIAAYDITDVLGTDFGPLDGGIGWGLWLTLASGLGLFAVLLRDWRKRTQGNH